MIQRTTLDNGISVLTERLTESHSVSLGVWVKNGSRHEAAPFSGVSHFVEHMLFKGTARRSSLCIAKEVDSVGGVINGFTSRELSCYYVKVLSEKLPLALDLLGDLLCHSTFDLDDIERERRVILQEIAMVEDNPEELVHDLFAESFWAGHPLGRSVIGNRQTVGELRRDDLLGFLAHRYYGENLIIAATGELEHDKVVSLVDRTFRDFPAQGSIITEEPPTIKRAVRVAHREHEQVHICLGVESLAHRHEDRYVAYLLNTILGGNMSSRLCQKVREELGAAYSVYSYLNTHSDSGALVLYAGTSKDDALPVVNAMLHEMNLLCQDPVSDEELSGAKDYLKGSLLLSMESSDNRMTRLAKNEIFLGRDVSLAESLRKIDIVNAEQMQQLAVHLFNDRTLNLQVVGPVDEHDFPAIDICLNS